MTVCQLIDLQQIQGQVSKSESSAILPTSLDSLSTLMYLSMDPQMYLCFMCSNLTQVGKNLCYHLVILPSLCLTSKISRLAKPCFLPPFLIKIYYTKRSQQYIISMKI